MTSKEWDDEVLKRTVINEGLRLNVYKDSLGIDTVGIGFNCTRGTAPLVACGIPNPADVLSGLVPLTKDQAYALCRNDLAFAVNDARSSLRQGIYDSLSDARRYVITDLCFNMGIGTWFTFIGTRGLIVSAQQDKIAGDGIHAHAMFQAAGEHLAASAYYQQTGDRAKRNVAMLVTGVWCNATGDGHDISQT